MGKIVVSEFVTLDGVMEAPNEWSFPYWNDDIGKFKLGEIRGGDALLLGRVTYEGFAAAWPERTDEEGFADRMNSLPKYVVSTALTDTAWNNSHIIAENIAEQVAALKPQINQDILINGSAQLIQSLMQADLIDEYRLLVFPVVLGKGKRLFQNGIDASLKLVETIPYDTGVVLLTYQPAPTDGEQ